ncbi:MAG TPA: RNA polymerase sigma factor [Pirellulales bacterium]
MDQPASQADALPTESPAAWSRDDFDRWYAEHHRALRAFVATRVGRADAEDVCQEIWTKVWENRDGFDGGQLRGWLFKVARNHCCDFLRKAAGRLHRRMLSIFSPPDGAADGPPIVERFIQGDDELSDEVLERLRHCLAELDDEKRALVEGWLSGEGYESFAPKLGLTTEQAHRRFPQRMNLPRGLVQTAMPCSIAGLPRFRPRNFPGCSGNRGCFPRCKSWCFSKAARTGRNCCRQVPWGGPPARLPWQLTQPPPDGSASRPTNKLWGGPPARLNLPNYLRALSHAPSGMASLPWRPGC